MLLKLTPPRPQARSMPPSLHICIPPRLHACSLPPKLPSFIPLRRHVCPLAACLPSSRASYLYVCTLAARLHTSVPPHLYTYSMPPEAQTSFEATSLRLHRASRAPPCFHDSRPYCLLLHSLAPVASHLRNLHAHRLYKHNQVGREGEA